MSNGTPDPDLDRSKLDNAITPIDGEVGIPSVMQARKDAYSRKGLFGVGLLVLFVVTGSAVWIDRAFFSNRKDPDTKRMADRPAAAAMEPRQLDMALPPVAKASSPASPHIPAIVKTASEEIAEPIGVRRTGQPAGSPPRIAPEDAPVVLVSCRPAPVRQTSDRPPRGAPEAASADLGSTDEQPLDSTKRNLEGYQRQLQGLLDTLTKTTTVAANGPANPATRSLASLPSPGGLQSAVTSGATGNTNSNLFGGQLQGSSTPRVVAGTLGNRSLTLPKGTAFTCALKTRVVSATSGFASCQVQRNVFGDDGRVLLIERGSHIDGEYRITTVRPGTVRIPILWTRIRTPLGVTVDIDSPGTGPLGESGIDGYVDNRWTERIGAAMLLSLIDDSVKLLIQNQSDDRNGDTFVLPSTTSSGSKLAEKVLDSTISIPPLIYQNQGAIVGIYVARDVDFASVYELKAVTR
jgi:type IV secretion system protein VirB10